MENIKNWDEAYRKLGKIREDVQEDMPRIVKLFKKYDVKKILDLGCGSGRHTVFLAKYGFEVFGVDISKHGIKIASGWLKKENLRAKLRQVDIYKKLPYDNNFFDAIVSTQTLHHAKIENIRNLIKEMGRILKPGGFVFVTVLKYFPKKNIRLIAPRTYLNIGRYDKGIPHYKFTRKILRKELRNFDIIDIWVQKAHYCLLAQIKKLGSLSL